MLNKIKHMFWRYKKARAKQNANPVTAGPAPAATPPAPASSPPLKWMETDDSRNPFKIPGFECLENVMSLISTTTKENVESFFRLRGDFGSHLKGKLPEDAVEISCLLEYAYTGEIADGAIFKAKKMEEKWDIYLYQPRIYFCRSWTGTLNYVADMEVVDGKIRITKIYAPRAVVGDEPEYVIGQVDYLKKSHLYNLARPHPVPKSMARDALVVGAFSFHQYGHRCCFATWEDTINYQLPPRPAPAT